MGLEEDEGGEARTTIEPLKEAPEIGEAQKHEGCAHLLSCTVLTICWKKELKNGEPPTGVERSKSTEEVPGVCQGLGKQDWDLSEPGFGCKTNLVSVLRDSEGLILVWGLIVFVLYLGLLVLDLGLLILDSSLLLVLTLSRMSRPPSDT